MLVPFRVTPACFHRYPSKQPGRETQHRLKFIVWGHNTSMQKPSKPWKTNLPFLQSKVQSKIWCLLLHHASTRQKILDTRFTRPLETLQAHQSSQDFVFENAAPEGKLVQEGEIQLPCTICISPEIQAWYKECISTNIQWLTINLKFILFYTTFFVRHPLVVNRPLL